MAAAGHRRPAVTEPVLIFLVSVLVVSASGLQLLPDEDPSTYLDSRMEFWYPRGEVIVIDLGNTNSCVAGYTGIGKTTHNDTMFQFCVPSWVAFTDNNGTALVGEAAKNHAAADPEATIFGFKRLLGLRRNREYQEDILQRAIQRVPYKIGTRSYDETVVQVKGKQLEFSEVASVLVAELKRKAEEHLGRTVKHAVMTIPQHFSGGHRGAAEHAGWLAGLDVVWTVAEPTAAAVAHGLHTRLRERHAALLLRVGGGTSDASVVVLLDGTLQVFGYGNDNFLGGDDFDARVVDHFARRIKAKHGVDIAQDRAALGKLRAACENAKKALSSQDRVQVTVVGSLVDGVDYFSEPLSRSEFEELNDDLFRKVMDVVDSAMVYSADITWSKSKIREIVLLGGSAKIPKIQSLVKDYFNGRDLNVLAKPDEAMASGATVYVHSLQES